MVTNRFGKEVNVLHFCGSSIQDFPITIKNIYNNIKLGEIDNNLTLLSCWTDDSKCILYGQLKKNNIKLHNAIPKEYNFNSTWYMPYKIVYILQYLLNSVTTEYTMILDGYDVLMTSTDNILKKINSQSYKILFNASPNNYPDIIVDNIPDREKLGTYRYFNAGCCIGKTKDLIKFYSTSLKYINVDNPKNSEQLIMRYAFSELMDCVGIDYNNLIFNCMGRTKVVGFKDSIMLEPLPVEDITKNKGELS